jgi:hypothetical protein
LGGDLLLFALVSQVAPRKCNWENKAAMWKSEIWRSNLSRLLGYPALFLAVFFVVHNRFLGPTLHPIFLGEVCTGIRDAR